MIKAGVFMNQKKLVPPSKTDINRLVNMSKGDSGFYLLSLFSFIEAYIRNNFSDCAYKDNVGDKKYFRELISKLEEFDRCFKKIPEQANYRLNKELIDFYTKYANKVRHTFATVDDNTLACVVKRFLQFADYHCFLIPELEVIGNGKEFECIKNHKRISGTDFLKLQEENIEISKKYENIKEKFDKQLELINNIEKENITLKEEIDVQNTKLSQLEKDAEEYSLNYKLILNHTQDYRDYQSRLLRLSEDQEKIILRIVNNINFPKEKDFLIKGGPGTGKTLVLIKILEKIINTDCKLLTYTDSLSKYNRYISEIYLDKNNEDYKLIDKMKKNIITFDEFFKIKLEVLLGKEVFFINWGSPYINDSKEYKQLLELIRKSRISNKFSAESILEQAIEDVWPNLLTRDEYINATYATNMSLTIEQIQDRIIIWDSIMSLVDMMNHESKILADYAYWKINTDSKFDNISENHKIDHLLIDEIQDLSTARIEILSKLTKKNCVMAGDLNQSIFIKRGISWKKLGYKVQGNTITLKTNYRSTVPIQKLASDYSALCKIHDPNVNSQAFIPGPIPELIIADSNNKVYNEILKKISWCKYNLEFEFKDICVVTINSDELSKLHSLLSVKGIPSNIIESADFDFKKDDNSIRLSTIKYIKGIDSPILILFLSEKLINKKLNGNMDSNIQMNCVYACITRAMDLLYIITTKEVANMHKIDKKTPNSYLIHLMSQ